MPHARFDPPNAQMQSSTEWETDAYTLQATTAGSIRKRLLCKDVPIFLPIIIFVWVKKQICICINGLGCCRNCLLFSHDFGIEIVCYNMFQIWNCCKWYGTNWSDILFFQNVATLCYFWNKNLSKIDHFCFLVNCSSCTLFFWKMNSK